MKNKQTKKRFGVLAVMLMLIVAIGATAGTTLAKYISSATVNSQQATVAMWGYTVTAGTDNLFSNQYGDVSGNWAKASTTGVVVKASGSGNVVAPGTHYTNGTNTEATMLTINGANTSEVSAKLTIDLTGFSTIVLKKSTTDIYYPVKWTVNGTAQTSDITSANDLAALIKSVLVADTTATWATATTVSTDGAKVVVSLPAGTAAISNYSLKLGWSWEYENSSADTAKVNNAYDTILGYIANGTTTGTYVYGGTTYNLADYATSVTTLSFALSATIEQVQDVVVAS